MKSHKKGILLPRAVLRIGVMILQVLAAFASDKPKKYNFMEAEQLYEDGLISDEEYAKAIYTSER